MRLLLLLGLLAALPAAAQTPGECLLGTAQADLSTPDLLARVFNTGSLFYGNGSANYYFVPRGTDASPVYAASLWLGGRVGGEVRTAGGTYGGSGLDYTFWPGPLDAGAALPNPTDCSPFDRIYVVTPADVAAYETGGTVTAALSAWPVGLGAPAEDAQGQPVAVTSRGQTLDLAAGERPVVYGGPTAFWVMNDVGNSHDESGSAPLGVEVRVTAFAVRNGPAAFRQQTFYRYTVVNRNTQPVEDFQLGVFVDADLGDAADDLVGADTTRGVAFVYNADDQDGDGSPPSYGTPPPAFGFDLLSSGLWAVSYYTGGGPPLTSDPNISGELYNRLLGLWNDGSTIREFGTGYNQTRGDVTRYTFAGDPVVGAFWSEVNTDSLGQEDTGDDIRFSLSTPPVTLASGASHTVDLALVFARGADNFDSVTALRTASDQIQAAYDAGTLFSGEYAEGTAAAPALTAPADGAAFYEADVTFAWEPVAGAEYYLLEVSPTADFADIDPEVVTGTTATYAAARFAANRTAPFYWRVRTGQGGLDGPPSAARAFTAYRYVAGPLLLASGAPAIVETTAPGGAPACDGPNDPDEGCAEVLGDLVDRSRNSSGDYVLFSLEPTTVSGFSPDDFEIRFTITGSVAVTTGGERRLFRVPFEVWDVGPVTPGQPNDPADDRQLIASVSGSQTTGCTFAYLLPTRQGIGPATQTLSASFAIDDDYAAYAAIADAAIAADPDGCPRGGAALPARARIDVSRGNPLRSVYLEQAGVRTVADLAGSTVRFYTADRLVAAETPAGAASALALGAPFPNPARGRVAVPYTVGAAGQVRLRLVDVLGRTVAVLAEGTSAAGTFEAQVDARRLAAGVYALVLDGGTARAVRTLTVVR